MGLRDENPLGEFRSEVERWEGDGKLTFFSTLHLWWPCSLHYRFAKGWRGAVRRNGHDIEAEKEGKRAPEIRKSSWLLRFMKDGAENCRGGATLNMGIHQESHSHDSKTDPARTGLSFMESRVGLAEKRKARNPSHMKSRSVPILKNTLP